MIVSTFSYPLLGRNTTAIKFPFWPMSPLILGFMLYATPLFAAQNEDYLSGYIKAVLDSQESSTQVQLVRVEPKSQEAILSAKECLANTKRGEIERRIMLSGVISLIQWQGPEDCPEDSVTPATPDEPTTDEKVELIALPAIELFEPIIADPRQPQFSIRYQYYETPEDTFHAASVSFGDYFGFASGLFGSSGVSQIGLQGAVFALFNLDAPSLDLVNADYWLGFPMSYRRGSWSFLGRLYHQSSHLGDEFLIAQPTISRINFSYEDIELLASYDWRQLRAYGGGGYLLHSEPKLKPWHAQVGLEAIFPDLYGPLSLVIATDIQADEETNWSYDRSFQVGFSLVKNNHQIRLMLEHFRGASPNGQFFDESLRYTGLGIYFDL